MRTLFLTVFALSLSVGGLSMPSFAQSGSAEGLPSWAQPSDERRSYAPPSQARHHRQPEKHLATSGGSTTDWQDRPANDPFGFGPTTNDNGNSCGAQGNPNNQACADFCTENPTDPQCQDNCDNGQPYDYCDIVRSVPVDDWLPLLALAGLGLGAYRIQRRSEGEMTSDAVLNL